MHKNESIICPKCGESEFLTRRWVRNSYYPKLEALEISVYETKLEQLKRNPSDSYAQRVVNIRKSFIRGKRYRGKSTKHLIQETEDNFDKEECYRVHTDRYYYFYIGHYDKDLYQKQKEDYELKKRKSKPTGRKWCKLKLPNDDRIYYNTKKVVSEKRLEYLKNFLIKNMHKFYLNS